MVGLPQCPRVPLNGNTESALSLSWVPTELLPTIQYQITTDPAIDGVNGTENTTAIHPTHSLDSSHWQNTTSVLQLVVWLGAVATVEWCT